MDQFDAEKLREIFDLFLLNRFSDGPLLLSEIERRVKPIFGFLDWVAARRPKTIPGSLLTNLQRLQREGWLNAERPTAEETEVLYSLTALGGQRIEAERVRQGAILSQFFEDSDPDKSFRRFLDRRGPLHGN